jgi:hypothetical protein
MIAASEDILMDLLRRAGRGDETALRELQQRLGVSWPTAFEGL